MALFLRTRRSAAGLTIWDKIKLARLIQDPVMIEKLKSRKLWVAVLSAAILALGQGIGLEAELLNKLVSLAMTYLAAQGVVDTAAALKR